MRTPYRTPSHTLVDQAVDAVKQRERGQASFVNAVLRRFLRERGELVRTQRQPRRHRVAAEAFNQLRMACVHVGERVADVEAGDRTRRATQGVAARLGRCERDDRPVQPFLDVRSPRFDHLHHPDDYSPSQTFAKPLRDQGHWGLVYRSVRHEGGECIAAFKPQAVSIPMAGAALAYVWDGERISKVYEKSEVLFDFSAPPQR